MSDSNRRLVLAPRTYRWTDRITKLAGVVLVALGLEVGGQTLLGIALGVTGAAFALGTVFVEPTTDSDPEATDE